MKLSARLTADKAPKWIDAIKGFLERGRVGHKELESLIGKLGFSQTCLFGKFARCQLRALYLKLRSKWFAPTITDRETLVFRWWVSVLQNVSPRIASSPALQADFIVYTDAATSSRLMASVTFEGHALGFRRATEAFTSEVPPLRMKQFLATNEIFGMELLAPVAFAWAKRAQLSHKRVTIYIDNSSALSALIRGDSLSPIAAALVAVFWHTAHKYNISIWIDRGASAKNIADLPTRFVKIASQSIATERFCTLFQLLTASLRWEI